MNNGGKIRANKKHNSIHSTGRTPGPLGTVSCVSAAAVYDSCMKALTIRLPDALVAEIENESRTRRISKSDVVRERLHAPVSGGSMEDLIGDVLEKSWRAKVPAGPPRFRSPKKQKLAGLICAKKLHRR